MAYSNLRITARLRTGVVSDAWLPLDGVLFYQAARRDLGQRPATIPGASGDPRPKGEAMPGGRLPIEIMHAKDWYYRCSWAEWGPHTDGQDHWNKRFDASMAYLVDFHGRRGRIDTSAATYRAYHMPVYYRAALWVRWYCVGDAEAIGELLRMATHLGKKSAQGWGRVAEWTVEEWPADWSIWREGKLMRGVPLYHLPKEMTAARRALYGIRPPYWDPRNQVELEMP